MIVYIPFFILCNTCHVKLKYSDFTSNTSEADEWTIIIYTVKVRKVNIYYIQTHLFMIYVRKMNIWVQKM